MRFWHQSLTELDKLPAYRDGMADHLLGQPDTVVDLHGMAPSTYVTLYPGVDLRYAARQAEAEGYDGFLLATCSCVHQTGGNSMSVPG